MPTTRKYALRSATRSHIYVFKLVDKECIKIGKCKGSPWDRVRWGQLARVVCPRAYKKRVAEPTNLRLLHCFAFPNHVDVHAVERAFHKRHRELARCGEWYHPDAAIDRLRCFVAAWGGRNVPAARFIPPRSGAPKNIRGEPGNI